MISFFLFVYLFLGHKADLNKGSGGKYVYLCYTRENGDPITNLVVLFGDKGEVLPSGYSMIDKTPSGEVANLNSGSGGLQAFLCFKRGRGPPITNIAVQFPSKGEVVPPGYIKLENTPSDFDADLNSGSGGVPVYLCYLKDMNNLKYGIEITTERRYSWFLSSGLSWLLLWTVD